MSLSPRTHIVKRLHVVEFIGNPLDRDFWNVPRWMDYLLTGHLAIEFPGLDVLGIRLGGTRGNLVSNSMWWGPWEHIHPSSETR